MKYKLLCDRCGAEKSFQHYANAYNNGRCYKCNGHGYILTKDELKAKHTHLEYLDVVGRKIEGYKLACAKELEVIEQLKALTNTHKQQYMEHYSKLDEMLNKINDVHQNGDKAAQQEVINEYIKVCNELEATKTDEYKREYDYLNKKAKEKEKDKERSLKAFEESQQFYNELIKPVE